MAFLAIIVREKQCLLDMALLQKKEITPRTDNEDLISGSARPVLSGFYFFGKLWNSRV
jgi:hypothetical protein